MKKAINLLSLGMITLTISACVHVTPEPVRNNNQFAMTSVRDSPKVYPQNSLFSLSPKYIQETSLKAKQTQMIYKLYTNSIVANLQQHDFKVANEHQKAAFHVGFGIALSNDFSDRKINEKYGISPGLPESNGFKKGSFLIYIEDASTGQIVWRGIAQGFAHEGLTIAQRKQRTAAVVANVMKQFYQTN